MTSTCVFAPPYNKQYAAHRTPNTSKENGCRSKLCELNLFIKNELRITAHIKHILPDSFERRFFLIKSSQKTGRDSAILAFPPSPVYLHAHLSQVSSTREFVYELIESYRYLLESLVVLTTHKIAHNHIQIDTLVMHPSGVVMIADFSNAINVATPAPTTLMHELLAEFEPHYIYRPIEQHLISYMKATKLDILSAYQIQWVIDAVFPDDHPILSALGSSFITGVRISAYAYYKSWENRGQKELIVELVATEHAHATWDMYGLSMVYIGILTDVRKATAETHSSVFLTKFIRLLIQTIHPVAEKRPFISQLQRYWTQFISNINPIEYSQLVQALQSVDKNELEAELP